jgi:predicted membrane channel-forming protein YqfA (hemolysin III family)
MKKGTAAKVGNFIAALFIVFGMFCVGLFIWMVKKHLKSDIPFALVGAVSIFLGVVTYFVGNLINKKR